MALIWSEKTCKRFVADSDSYAGELWWSPPYESIAASYDNVTRVDINGSAAVGNRCKGLLFVFYGTPHIFANRDEFSNYVRSQGGHMAGSISPQTDYLINAGPDYPAYKARLQGVSVMTEDEFVKTFGKPE